MITVVDAAVRPEVAIAKLEVTTNNHERRITALENLVWKLFAAALTGAIGGGAAAVAIARAFWVGS